MKRYCAALLFLSVAGVVLCGDDGQNEYDLFSAEQWAEMRKVLETATKGKTPNERIRACETYIANYSGKTICFIGEVYQLQEQKYFDDSSGSVREAIRQLVDFTLFGESPGWRYIVDKDKAPGEFVARTENRPGTKAILKGMFPSGLPRHAPGGTIAEFKGSVEFVKLFPGKPAGKPQELFTVDDYLRLERLVTDYIKAKQGGSVENRLRLFLEWKKNYRGKNIVIRGIVTSITEVSRTDQTDEGPKQITEYALKIEYFNYKTASDPDDKKMRWKKDYGEEKSDFGAPDPNGQEYAARALAVFAYKSKVGEVTKGDEVYLRATISGSEEPADENLTGIKNTLSFWKTKRQVESGQTEEDVSIQGKPACKRCGGSGKVECRICKGSGSKRCWNCKGNGLVKCSKCDGYGKVHLGRNCPKCNRYCGVCGRRHAGSVHCSSCERDSSGVPTGKKKCSSCKGSRKKKCYKCKGTGKGS